MIVNKTPYPLSFEMEMGQSLVFRYGEEGRQYSMQPDVDVSGLVASLQIVKPDNTFVIASADIVEPEEGPAYIVLTIPLQATVVKGMGHYSIFIQDDADMVIYSAEGQIWIDDHLITNNMIESAAEVYGLRFPQDFLTVDNLVDIVNYVSANLINDEAVAENTTWSSQKIDQEIAGIEPEPITVTEQGNPIEFTDAAAAPLVKCTTTIQGYQEGTGTPSPDNVRPIHAYTQSTISVEGRNLLNTSTNVDGKYLGVDGIERTDTNFNYTDLIAVGTEITISGKSGYAQNANRRIHGYNSLGTWVEQIDVIEGAFALGNPYSRSVTIPSGISYIKFSYPKNDSEVQIERGDTAHAYEEYITPIDHTTTYPSAIYQGSEDVVGGSVQNDWLHPDLPLQDWRFSSQYNIFYCYIQGKKKGKLNIVCSHYAVIDKEYSQMVSGEMVGTSTGNGINIKDDRFDNITDFVNFLTNQSVDMYVEAETPTISPVTPTNLPIKSLFGYNHIESSTGDMTIEYLTNYYQPLAEIIEQGDMHNYSTVERVIGKWIDGKDLYEITLDITSPASINTNATVDSLASLSFDKIVSVEGMIYAAGVSQYVPIFWSYNTSIIGTVYIDGTNLKQIVSSSAYCNCREWITIRYTKTT